MARRTRIDTDPTIDVHRRRRRRHPAWPTDREWRQAEDRGVGRLTVVRPVAKTALTPGTVVWAHVTYEDGDGWKLRPAVVAGLGGRDVTLYPGTSAPSRHRYPGAYRELTDLDAAGLRLATGIHLQPVTVDVIDVVAVAGYLGADDRAAICVGGAENLDSPMMAAA